MHYPIYHFFQKLSEKLLNESLILLFGLILKTFSGRIQQQTKITFAQGCGNLVSFTFEGAAS